MGEKRDTSISRSSRRKEGAKRTHEIVPQALNGLVLGILDLLLDLVQPDRFLDDEMVGRVSLKRRKREIVESAKPDRKERKERRAHLFLHRRLEDHRVKLIRIFVAKSDDSFIHRHESSLKNETKGVVRRGREEWGGRVERRRGRTWSRCFSVGALRGRFCRRSRG